MREATLSEEEAAEVRGRFEARVAGALEEEASARFRLRVSIQIGTWPRRSWRRSRGGGLGHVKSAKWYLLG